MMLAVPYSAGFFRGRVLSPRPQRTPGVTGATAFWRPSGLFGSFSVIFLPYFAAIFYPKRPDWA
jgi:hypothetical protein